VSAGAGIAPGSRRPPRVVIIGAGVAGLSCAHRLQSASRQARRALQIILLEASARPGGVIDTEQRDGFLIEGGPDCFISEKPWAIALCRELGIEDQLIGTNPSCRRSYVLRRGRIMPIPEGYQLMAPGRLMPFATSPILSIAGRLRAACDLILPRGRPVADESLASFVRRRFGAEVLEGLAQPLLAGIYNADPEQLSLRATMPRFLDMERNHRSVILALLLARWRGRTASAGVSGARYSLFMTLKDGLGALVERLSGGLAVGTLRPRTEVATVERGTPAVGDAGTSAPWHITTAAGEGITADAVVLAMPAHAAGRLLTRLDPALAQELQAIPYGTSVTVSLGYRQADLPRPLNGFGFVVPRTEKRSLIACSLSSVKFAGRAPDGMILLRSFLGGPAVQASGGDPARLEAMVRHDLGEILGIRGDPMVSRTCVWPQAMAQYAVGHLERVQSIDARVARHPGLALAGNGLRGVGIPDCVHSGQLAADALLDVIASPASAAR